MKWAKGPRVTVLIAFAWIVAMAAGFCAFDVYDLKATGTGSMTEQWPVASSLRIMPGVMTIIMALHPRCPCSEASLSELQKVLAHQHARINVHLLVYQPKGYPQDWGMTELVRRAQADRGMDVTMDRGGNELVKFHARVSGELWFYDGNGKLLFRGGITGGRGHAGRNTGISSLMALVDGRPPVAHEAPVFGCAIGGEDLNANTPTE